MNESNRIELNRFERKKMKNDGKQSSRAATFLRYVRLLLVATVVLFDDVPVIAVLLVPASVVDAFSGRVMSSSSVRRTKPNLFVQVLNHDECQCEDEFDDAKAFNTADNGTDNNKESDFLCQKRSGRSRSIEVSRRLAIRNAVVISASAATAVMVNPSFPAIGYAGEDLGTSANNNVVNLDCLKDLPPLDDDNYIRVYFCRHGQTENNRLRIVQGARVDPPINVNGKAQATNLGLALGRSELKPEMFFSSSLLRAKMTAEIAAENAISSSSNNNSSNNNSAPRVRELSSLAEIDFGPVADGQPIAEVKEKMYEAYTKWSVGQIDYRPEGGGDNGREVLTRASEALVTLVDEAKAAGVPCVAAVTHSAYLRVLIGLLLNEPLIKSSVRKVRNGSVTVVDVPKDYANNNRTIGPKSKLFGGLISQQPKDFDLSIPRCKTIRINEVQHLPIDTI